MTKILKFLSGKKGAIASLIVGTIAYLAVKGVIGEAEVIYFTLINAVIFSGASYITGKLVYNK